MQARHSTAAEATVAPLELDHYRYMLDALPFGVAFAVPVFRSAPEEEQQQPVLAVHRNHHMSSNDKKKRRQKTHDEGATLPSATSRVGDFRFLFTNRKLTELASENKADEEILPLRVGELLSTLADRSLNGEKAALKEKQEKKKKRGAAALLARQLLKAHRRAWRTGQEVQVFPVDSSSKPRVKTAKGDREEEDTALLRRGGHLVKLLRQEGGEAIGVLTTFGTCCARPTKTEKRAEAKHSDIPRKFIANMSVPSIDPFHVGVHVRVLILPLHSARDKNTDEWADREVVETMYSSSQHLLMLINDVLDYSKMSQPGDGEDGTKLKITTAPVNLCKLVHDCVSTYAPQARDCNVDVIIRVAPGIVKHPFFYTDPVRVRQVLANLVSNSVKFTKEGFVLVEVDDGRSHQQETSHETAGEVREMIFRVIDTGFGVKKENKDTIFLPYMQEKSEDTESCGGTGLGLPIARQIARCMGGSLELECVHQLEKRRRSIDPTSAVQRGISTLLSKSSTSYPKPTSSSTYQQYPIHSDPARPYSSFTRTSGSTFTFRLPMKIDKTRTSTKEVLPSLVLTSANSNSPTPMKILLVGLHPVMSATLSELLTSVGAKCDSCASKEEALRLLTSSARAALRRHKGDFQRWDVVAVFKGADVEEGFEELISKIRREEKVQALPKVMMLLLAYTSDCIDTRRLEENGWDAYFSLPLHPTDFLQVMARLRDEANKANKSRSRRTCSFRRDFDYEFDQARRNWQKNNRAMESNDRLGLRLLRRKGHSNDRIPRGHQLSGADKKHTERPNSSSPRIGLITKYSHAKPKPKMETSISQWGELTALVADDNAINRKVAERMLENMGFRKEKIVHAYDGEEALNRAREKNFDIVLMDCFMPRMNGWECSQLLRSSGYKGTIIATTGVATSVEITRCHESGMDACIRKPLVLDVFRDTLHKALQARLGSPGIPTTEMTSDTEPSPESSTQVFPMGLPTSASAPSVLFVSQVLKERNQSF